MTSRPAGDDVMSWLLAGDPAVVWQVQRDLLGRPRARWQSTRSQVAGQGWGAQLLAARNDNGYWPGWYSPKWTSTFYSLQLAARFGLTAAQVGAALDQLLAQGYRGAGRFALWSSGEPDICVTGMLLTTMHALGAREDPRWQEMADWLTVQSMPGGGWNCRRSATHASFASTLSVLEPGSTDAPRSERRQ